MSGLIPCLCKADSALPQDINIARSLFALIMGSESSSDGPLPMINTGTLWYFCEIFLFFLFIIYLYSNCVYFIFKYVFLTESLKCKKHGKNPDNTVPSSLRFHRFPPLPAHMSCALLQLLTQQPRRDFEASTDSHCRCSAVLRY